MAENDESCHCFPEQNVSLCRPLIDVQFILIEKQESRKYLTLESWNQNVDLFCVNEIQYIKFALQQVRRTCCHQHGV